MRKLDFIISFILVFSVLFINRIFSGHAFLGGVFGFVLNGAMQILAFIGLIAVEFISILLVIDTMKYIFKRS